MNTVLIAKSDDDIRSCYKVVVQLRPTYSEEAFLNQVKKQMKAGYSLAYIKSDSSVCAVAGFRYSESLAWGKYLYVDDLITTDDERSKGYGKFLLGWLKEQAKINCCQQLHLDSGVQRKDAHRFYARENMLFTSHHYAIEIE